MCGLWAGQRFAVEEIDDESGKFGTQDVSERETGRASGSARGLGSGKSAGGACVGRQENLASAADAEASSADRTSRVAPNYALEERFLPDQVGKLVFDLAVTPHWFGESDRFWYSYETPEGTRYYLVDPGR